MKDKENDIKGSRMIIWRLGQKKENGKRRFTSGITIDGLFIISMEDYSEYDVIACWNRSKWYHGKSETENIDPDDYEEKYMTERWDGDMFYPTFHERCIEGSKRVRVYKIKEEINIKKEDKR